MRPERLGPYRVTGNLGRGGLGVVYRAVDDRTAEEVAVKLLVHAPASKPRAVQRFHREFEALASLDHPYVVHVIDSGLAGDMPYFAMELIEGLDIRSHLDGVVAESASWSSSSGDPAPSPAPPPRPPAPRADSDSMASGPFDVDAWLAEPDSDVLLGRDPSTDSGSTEVLALFGPAPSVEQPYDAPVELREPVDIPDLEDDEVHRLNNEIRVTRVRELSSQVCDALAYIHARGLVHRDLKPSNIMVDVDGDVRLMDFGLCKNMTEISSVTDSRHVVGTYRYMSPEQAAGEPVDARSDLYSLGVLLYEFLSGRPPFLAKNPLDVWHELMESEPPPLVNLNPHVDPQLARLTHILLRKDPADRLQTAEEVVEALLE